MGTVKRDGKEYGTCRCGKPIVSVGRSGTCWRHEDYEPNCPDGGCPKEPNGQDAVTLDLGDGHRNGSVPEPIRRQTVGDRFPVGEAWWCQPKQRARTLYRGGRIVEVDGDEVSLEPLAPDELGQPGAPVDAEWNLDEPVTLPSQWVKQRIK